MHYQDTPGTLPQQPGRLAVRGEIGFFLTSLLCGLTLGALTLLGQAVLPNGIQRMSNSGAVWVVVAFVVGRFAKSWRAAALAGFIALVGEIAGYYGASTFVIPGEPDLVPYLVVILMWGAAALAAGPLVGSAGYGSSHASGRLKVIASGVLGGVFIGEGLALITQLDYWQEGLACLVIAVIVTLIIVWKSGARWQSLAAAAVIGAAFFGGELVLFWLDGLRGSIF